MTYKKEDDSTCKSLLKFYVLTVLVLLLFRTSRTFWRVSIISSPSSYHFYQIIRIECHKMIPSKIIKNLPFRENCKTTTELFYCLRKGQTSTKSMPKKSLLKRPFVHFSLVGLNVNLLLPLSKANIPTQYSQCDRTFNLCTFQCDRHDSKTHMVQKCAKFS